MEKYNIYQKLALARNLLRLKNIKPTGKNQGRFTYYELEDILPAVTEICADVGLLPIMNYYEDRALLTIYDTGSDATIELGSPMSTAQLAGCHPVQNLGAAQTYLKRYLYMHAFDIAESDVLDGTVDTGKGKSQKPAAKPAPTQKEAPKSETKAPADIAEYLLQKGFDAQQAAKCGAIWDEAKTVLPEAEIRTLKGEFRTIHTPEELEEWYREIYWKVDAAHKMQDEKMEGKSTPEEFKDDSRSLYEEDK